MHHRTVVQHIAQVDQAAVEHGLDEIVRIVEVDDPFIMGPGNLFRQHHTSRQVPGNFPGDQVPLGGNHDGVLIGVFLHNILIFIADQAQDGFIGGIGLADQGPVVPIDDIGLSQFVPATDHDLFFHHILDIFHQQTLFVLMFYKRSNLFDIFLGKPLVFFYGFIRFRDGRYDFAPVKGNGRAVSLYYFHCHNTPTCFLIFFKFILEFHHKWCSRLLILHYNVCFSNYILCQSLLKTQ